ncbi:MAG: hypothetical protein WDW38_000705 [Sanguina aurantia]
MLLLSRGASARRGVVARSRRSSPSPGLTGGRGECGAAAAFPETLPKAREGVEGSVLPAGVLQEGEGPGDVGRELDDLLPAEQAPLQPAVQALVGEVLLHDPEGGGGGVGGGLSPGGGGRGCRCEGGGGGEGVGWGSGAEGLALWPRNCERGGGAWIAPTPNNTCPGATAAAAAADGAGHVLLQLRCRGRGLARRWVRVGGAGRVVRRGGRTLAWRLCGGRRRSMRRRMWG